MEEVEEVKALLKDKMENVVDMSCPLKADISVGKMCIRDSLRGIEYA